MIEKFAMLMIYDDVQHSMQNPVSIFKGIISLSLISQGQILYSSQYQSFVLRFYNYTSICLFSVFEGINK